jgi:hypothetical protein
LGDAEADSDARDFDSDGRGADEYDSDARDYDSDGDGSDDYDSNARDYDSNARDYDSDGGGSDDYDSDTGDYDSDVNGRSNPGGYGKESGAHESRRGREARVTGAKVWNEADWDRTGRNQEGGESPGWHDDRPAESRPEFTPGASLYHWKVDLVLRTEYGRVVDLLTALAESRRHWRVSELSLERSGGSIEARLLLETFTHPGSGGEGPQEFGPLASEDPFRISIQEARRQAIPVAPALRAVVSGRVPRAWIGGEIATTGDTVADWTVEVIDDDGVWIRHATGQRVRLSVGG